VPTMKCCQNPRAAERALAPHVVFHPVQQRVLTPEDEPMTFDSSALLVSILNMKRVAFFTKKNRTAKEYMSCGTINDNKVSRVVAGCHWVLCRDTGNKMEDSDGEGISDSS
jgi:hypothetical protein